MFKKWLNTIRTHLRFGTLALGEALAQLVLMPVWLIWLAAFAALFAAFGFFIGSIILSVAIGMMVGCMIAQVLWD